MSRRSSSRATSSLRLGIITPMPRLASHHRTPGALQPLAPPARPASAHTAEADLLHQALELCRLVRLAGCDAGDEGISRAVRDQVKLRSPSAARAGQRIVLRPAGGLSSTHPPLSAPDARSYRRCATGSIRCCSTDQANAKRHDDPLEGALPAPPLQSLEGALPALKRPGRSRYYGPVLKTHDMPLRMER